MKTASIIIPTFNRADLVHRAVESAINQTYPCEIILCDHGSTDNTPEVAAHYKDKIRYVRREEDRGPIVCWRDGLEQSTGEIIHFTYDDDWLEPTFMEKTIAKLDDDIGFVYTNVNMCCQNRNITSILYRRPSGIGRMKDIAKYLIQAPLTISPGCAIFRRKDALKNLLLQIPNSKGIYGKDSGVGEDLLLFLLTSLDYPKYVYIKEPLACFLYHSGSITAGARLTGNRRDLVDSYTNAKLYYFSLPGSISPPTSLQNLLFTIKRWTLLFLTRVFQLLKKIKTVIYKGKERA
ncbi:MAG: glycosyltransferase family 2 protein [Planctomycetota bacterium]|nr:MAG: glycosyltransferase family 2 protein [Planctomycetota bacterium]